MYNSPKLFNSRKLPGTYYFPLVNFALLSTCPLVPILHCFIPLPNSHRYSTEFGNQLQVLFQGRIIQAQKQKIILLVFLFSPKKVHSLSEIQANRDFLHCPCIRRLKGELVWMVRIWIKSWWKSFPQTPRDKRVGWARSAQEQGTPGALVIQS